jgi:hypothetical protein
LLVDGERLGFGDHAVLVLKANSCVLDACTGPHLATQKLRAYLEAIVDFDDSLYQEGRKCVDLANLDEEDAAGVTDLDWAI